MSQYQQWEYRVQTFGSAWKETKDEEIEMALNEWGEDGWEVFDLFSYPSSNKVRATARRLLTSRVRRQRTLPSY